MAKESLEIKMKSKTKLMRVPLSIEEAVAEIKLDFIKRGKTPPKTRDILDKMSKHIRQRKEVFIYEKFIKL